MTEIKLKTGIVLACSLFIMCSCHTKNSQSYDDNKILEVTDMRTYDDKIWETTDSKTSDLNGKWLHPFGDRIWEITNTQIIERFFNGDKTISNKYRTENEEIFFLDNNFTYKIFHDDIMLLDLKSQEGKSFWARDRLSEDNPSFYAGFYHRINNTEVTALREGRYDYTYSFGKWAYRNDDSQAPSYWLRTFADMGSLDSLEFINDKKLMIRRITFVEENRNKNPWGGFVSKTRPEECEYEIMGSDLIIKTSESLLKLKIVNKKTIFFDLDKSVFIYDLGEDGYLRY